MGEGLNLSELLFPHLLPTAQGFSEKWLLYDHPSIISSAATTVICTQ